MTKCFWCSKKAILTGYTCSPTSASGRTSTKPFCASCAIEVEPEIVDKLVDDDEFTEAFRIARNEGVTS